LIFSQPISGRDKLLMKITTKSKIEKRLPDMKHNSEKKVEDNFRQPVFWQTPCCTFALSPWSSTMWVCAAPQGVACALAQGRLFCKVGFCVLALCALQMCLPWCVGYYNSEILGNRHLQNIFFYFVDAASYNQAYPWHIYVAENILNNKLLLFR